MRLVRGDQLRVDQMRQVLHQFRMRWTHENAQQNYSGRCPGCVQHEKCGGSMFIEKDGKQIPWHEYHVPLVSDEQWLKDHAFYITNSGRLSDKHSHCEPAFLADEKETV